MTFSIGSAMGVGTTDGNGHASATLTLAGPAAVVTLDAAFADDASYGGSNDSAAFEVLKEDTSVTLADAVAGRTKSAIAVATLAEADGAPLAAQSIDFYIQDLTEAPVQGDVTYTLLGTAPTDADGKASIEVPPEYLSRAQRPIRAVFAGDDSFHGATGDAFASLVNRIG